MTNLWYFFLFFLEKRIWHFMQIVSWGDNLREVSNQIVKCLKMLSAEIFTQHAKYFILVLLHCIWPDYSTCQYQCTAMAFMNDRVLQEMSLFHCLEMLRKEFRKRQCCTCPCLSVLQTSKKQCQEWQSHWTVTLGKHVYSHILKILPPKNENFQIKILIFFIFLFKTLIVGIH